jgi:RimJ/RimL family protein N-acetyltransferase
MFALTPRLTLRHGWPEDAPDLARAIGREEVVRNLARAPWPYSRTDAQDFLSRAFTADAPAFLVFDRTTPTRPLIGGIGVDLHAEDGPELGYWFAPEAWGRGFATEAGRAVVAIARNALRLPRLSSGHFLDNPASGRVLRKLGFRPTGRVVQRESRARGHAVPCALFELDLADSDAKPLPIAA